jgi:hypothetical protein
MARAALRTDRCSVQAVFGAYLSPLCEMMTPRLKPDNTEVLHFSGRYICKVVGKLFCAAADVILLTNSCTINSASAHDVHNDVIRNLLTNSEPQTVVIKFEERIV